MLDSAPRLLIVDDSEQNRILMQLYLRGSGCDVEMAEDAQTALDRIEREDFDLLLLDVVMPGMDGIELCERIKSVPRTSRVPVIFVTSRAQSEQERLRAFAVGAVDYISRPVQRAELIARIRVMLDNHQQVQDLEAHNRELSEQLVTARRAGESLAEERALYEHLADCNARRPAFGLRLDGAGRVVDAWPGHELLFGQAGVSVIGRPLDGLLEVPLLSRLGAEPVQTRTAAGVPVEIAVSGPGGEAGRPRWVLVFDLRGAREIEERIGRGHVMPAPTERDWATEDGYSIRGFRGRSPRIRELTRQVDMLRRRFVTTLIHGESGTGKELVARALHFDGPFADRPFIPIHCGAISPELIESELFGYEKGAFTGAQQTREGLFKAADGGTVFLDEIAETPLDLQVKLLRVLQDGEVRPVGANRARQVDVRIIAATNGDLRSLVEDGAFREDLFYRLDVVTVQVPPLRNRTGDIEVLVDHFLRAFNERHRLADPVQGISRGALQALQAYPWPGNVRELENVVDRAFALGCTDVLRESDLPAHILDNRPRTGSGPMRNGTRPREAVVRSEIDRQTLEAVLRRHPDDRRACWEELGIGRSTFYRYLQRFDIDPQRRDGDAGASPS